MRVSPHEVGVLVLADPAVGKQALEQFRQLRQGGFIQPVLLVVREVHLPTVVQAMREGAVAVLDPHTNDVTIARELNDALSQCVAARDAHQQRQHTLERLQALADGELDVLRGMLEGQLNKRVANQLSISERTVEARRKRIFDKMETRSVACLTRKIVESIGYDQFLAICDRGPHDVPAPHFASSHEARGDTQQTPGHTASRSSDHAGPSPLDWDRLGP